jgi:hypothetical protein
MLFYHLFKDISIEFVKAFFFKSWRYCDNGRLSVQIPFPLFSHRRYDRVLKGPSYVKQYKESQFNSFLASLFVFLSIHLNHLIIFSVFSLVALFLQFLLGLRASSCLQLPKCLRLLFDDFHCLFWGKAMENSFQIQLRD